MSGTNRPWSGEGFQGTVVDNDQFLMIENATSLNIRTSGLSLKTYITADIIDPWARNAGSGFIFPKVLTDKTGFGTDTPTELVTVADGNILLSGSFRQTSLTPAIAGSVTDASLEGAIGVYVLDGFAYVTSETAGKLTTINIADHNNPAIVDSTPGTATAGAFGIFVQDDFAYVGSRTDNSLTVFDVSDPASPTELGFVQNAVQLNGAGSVYMSGKHAYVSCRDGDAVTVVDISDPTNPTITGTTGIDANLDGAHDIYVYGKYAYVAASNANSLTVVDISDPANPAVFDIITDNVNLEGARGVYIRDTFAYVASGIANSFVIIDIGVVSGMSIIGQVTDNVNLAGASSVYVAGNYAYVPSTSADSVTVIDISDPTSPFIVGTLTDGTDLNGAHGIFIAGEHAYVACESGDSLTVVDINGINVSTAEIGNARIGSITVSDNITTKGDIYTRNLNVSADVLISKSLTVNGNISINGNSIDKVGFLESNATNPANAGVIRLGNTESIQFRNSGNTANSSITFDSSNQFIFGVPTSNDFLFNIGGTTKFEVTPEGTSFLNTPVVGATYYQSFGGSENVSGAIRLGNTETVSWRNFGDTADIGFGVNVSDQFFLGATTILGGNSILEVNHLEFNSTPASIGTIRLGDGQSIGWNNSTDDNTHTIGFGTNVFDIRFDGGLEYAFSATALTLTNANIVMTNGLINMGTSNIINLGNPDDTQDATPKIYVDSTSGFIGKKSAIAATTVNGVLTTAFEDGEIIDGVTLVTGQRILIKNQTAPDENGIYTVNATGAPTRATDADTAAELNEIGIFVTGGTANSNLTFIQVDTIVTLETDPILFIQNIAADVIRTGKKSLYVHVNDMYPNVTDGALDVTFESATNLINVQAMTFLAAVDNFASYTWIPPPEWDAGTITVKYYWSSPNGTATQVVEFQITANAYSNGDTIDVAYPATVSVTDVLTAVGALDISDESSDITIGNTPVKGDAVVIQIERDALAGSDTLTGAVRLAGMEIFYTTDDAGIT